MSQRLINRSPDLKRLRDEGYDIEIVSGFLIMRHIPYVTSNREVAYGILVSQLSLAGDKTRSPEDHVAHFIGDYPCNVDGLRISKIENASGQRELAKDVMIEHSFSSKPLSGAYNDYYEKMTTYAAIISSPAQAIDSGVTAKTFPVIPLGEDESVFKYTDTASSRAEIVMIARKLEIEKVGIVGLGGTGSYVLDLVAKTPVKEIHLFDGDMFIQHNAFRSPGAASIDEMNERPKKVTYLKDQYSKMRWNIFAHDFHIDESNVEQLHDMNFVFICIDKGSVKKLIVESLEKANIPFVDVGMGVLEVDGMLQGILRVTTSANGKREHINKRVSFSDGDDNNDYSRNIQVADLNALNAALAVIKWKKLYKFYSDIEQEHFSAYTIDGNSMINEDLV